MTLLVLAAQLIVLLLMYLIRYLRRDQSTRIPAIMLDLVENPMHGLLQRVARWREEKDVIIVGDESVEDDENVPQKGGKTTVEDVVKEIGEQEVVAQIVGQGKSCGWIEVVPVGAEEGDDSYGEWVEFSKEWVKKLDLGKLLLASE